MLNDWKVATDTYFFQIPYGSVDELDLKWLREIINIGYTGHTVENMLNEWSRGLKQFWRLRGANANGLLVTGMQDFPTERELVVVGLAGDGLAKVLKSMLALLEAFGRDMECTCITGLTTNPKLAKVYPRRLGVKYVGIVYRKEL